MPQPNKKRGRRMGDKKRKHEDGDDDPEPPESSSKRQKSTNDDMNASHVQSMSLESAYPPMEKAFFGVLDDEEQEYFKRADDMLESNAFGDHDERSLFLANVYREADGKELKIAQSQSCSRLMERLIQFSTPSQLKTLFEKFGGNFIHLVTHRFASHCCEALFLRAAPVVSEELGSATPYDKPNGTTQIANGGPHALMESFYLTTLGELEGNVGYLLTDRYASHVLRVLLLVFSGEPINTASTKSLLQSKRKETNAVAGTDQATVQTLDKARSVPQSFSEALKKLIADSITGLDTEKLRALATHPNGNPTLQLLLRLELTHYGKSRGKDENSIIRTLLPDDPITADSGSAGFMSGLVYDPIGSHLAETIVQHAPGKTFKNLYSEFFRERMPTHARNEAAGYVVCRILERLGQDDLLDAHERLVPVVTELLQRGRTVVVRTLIERCTVRGIDTQAIAVQVDATWHGSDGFEVKKLLKFEEENALDVDPGQDNVVNGNTGNTTDPSFARSGEHFKAHFNVLAQSMLVVPGSLSALVLDSLITLDPQTLISMAKDSIVSRTLQAALTSRTASIIIIRKLIQHFYGHMGEMAVDKAASHVVDSMWEGTHGLAFIRERIAEELAENEAQLRESSCGRAVWKNWKMDLYKRRRADWIKQSKMKASNDGFQSFAELDTQQGQESVKKTPIQLARERNVKNKEANEKGRGRATNRRPAAPPTSIPAPAAKSTAST
ncbi:Glutamate decarboxylase 2 [Vermiconidia calcicola]|uniref:Glutamate decarboxylase 2 n=1 Tax=Vermiconidia calcicola TaxID=1690605 RepID=A0ACC3MKZ5_9PEZI|nr:Glutamate decarboxylase 2 [Vermiconidia calcicola]